ncbi:unnamed protein product [Owenia fusiformis]|uniref:Uncharacterized protein n=1 Tax=Owenia fusiformis TaxID=6347 RepID=A0A8J1TTW5_OWEFU|nr:unnamed protein product [Owenia fusiformis]
MATTSLCVNTSTSQLTGGSTPEMEFEVPRHLYPVSPYEDLGRSFAVLVREHIKRRNEMKTGELDSVKMNYSTERETCNDIHLTKETQKIPNDLKSKELHTVTSHTSTTSSIKSNTDKSKNKKWKPANHLLNIKYDNSEVNRKIGVDDEHPWKTQEIAEIMAHYDEELESYETTYGQFEHHQIHGSKGNRDYLRKDKGRKVQSAKKQIKQKQCRKIHNSIHNRSKLFMHHRVYKLICLRLSRANDQFQPILKYKHSEAAVSCKNKIDATIDKISSPKTPRVYTPTKNYRTAQVHTLLNTTSAPKEFSSFDTTVVSAFINLQHREITPEDFDLLLNLDDLCKPKTVNTLALSSLRVEAVHEHDILEDPCAVCMEFYLVGQCRKYLPCGHVFHETCIDQWLTYSSTTCPLDGIPIDST